MTRRSPAPNRIGTDSTIVGGSLKRPDTGTSASEFDAADPPPGTSGEHKPTKKKTATHKGIDTTGLSVDRFLDKYTSEDNASFEDLCEVGARREKIDHRWMYDAAARHNKERVTFVENVALKGADEQILAKSLVSGETDSDTRPNQPDNYPIKARNEVLFFREEVPLTAEEQVRRAKMQEREVQSAHTRFKEAPFADESRKETLARAAMMQAALSKGHIDATGVELTTALGDAIVHVQQKFSNVVTPSPMPGVDESPLMTWGEIEGTPFRLDAGDMPVRTADLGGPSFRIPDVPLRDKLAHTVVDDISKVYHGKRKAAVEAATKAHP
jgi:protein DGCR14